MKIRTSVWTVRPVEVTTPCDHDGDCEPPACPGFATEVRWAVCMDGEVVTTVLTETAATTRVDAANAAEALAARHARKEKF